MKDENALIYGVKSNNKIHYIGKTKKKVEVDGKIAKSKITVQYFNKNLHSVFQNYDVTIQPIVLVPESQWYSEKLREVVEHAAKNHPLVNARWMIEGKRGYWQGKKRDAHTLFMLSISKYKTYVEYHEDGRFKKVWSGGKEAAIQVFKDYRVVNGSASSKLYGIVSHRSSIRNRFACGSYWFKLEELAAAFGGIPKVLDIKAMIRTDEECTRARRRANSPNKSPNQMRYTVELYDRETNLLITIYQNTEEAAYVLKTSVETIRRICNGTVAPLADFIIKYGEKTLQPKNIRFPEHVILPLKRLK